MEEKRNEERKRERNGENDKKKTRKNSILIGKFLSSCKTGYFTRRAQLHDVS
jgi:hypothetical protein